ncbi:cytoskeleton protein RodZ [Halospina denitrificans]|uniref:Cytoskeleton protein RodZ n=1 Tax=Halospina denitrificans TaxID=332522 RepID=A0A4R7JTI3_9GAMM|nr:helix-turn-helix domain-containing protein [Halospina denitrificans]TDT41631.1 cytoskeleton protein RodZ [Halospina denitrificans]
MTDEESENTKQENGPETVGETLRAARERHNLELQAVADQLHLRPSIIRAIEEGDYQSMPGELFLKGYVRSYARLTEQDGDDLVMRLDRELAPLRREEQQKEPSTTEIIQLRKERRRRVVGTLIALVAALIVGWVLLFYGPWIADETGDLIDETGEQGAEQGESPAATEPDGDTSDEDAGSTPASEEAEPEGPEGDASTESSPTSMAPVPVVDAPEERGQQQTNESSPRETSALETVSLVISFNDACWVEVVNGEGERVIVTLAEAGRDIEYEGPGPLEVLLGNVDAVAGIRFKGEPIDLEDYPVRAGRTQFVLGASNGTS